MSLNGKTLLISGASRGIGKAIALRAAQDGANIAVVSKTAEPHPKLEGTIHTAVEEINAGGGRGLACQADIRFEEQVDAAVETTVSEFGGIDIVVNNASAIQLTGTLDTEMKRFDLMQSINGRGTYLLTKKCLPYLLEASNPHILAISPPLNMEGKWFGPHPAYTISKFNMSLCILGFAEEFRQQGVAANALWPKTTIATAAIQNLLGGDELMKRSRKPSIMADAAHAIFIQDSRECTGNFFVDEEVLKESGVTDLDPYSVVSGADLAPDFFI